MKMKDKLSEEQLVECYDLVFDVAHSGGFKESEMKDLLFSEDYWFNTRPKKGWRESLEEYLTELKVGVDLKHLDKYEKL